MDIKCGVPQESVLGSLLFLIYIIDNVNVYDLAELIMFADDTNVVLNNKSVDDLSKWAIIAVDKLVLWLKLNKLSLNITKTNFILFHISKKSEIKLI